MGIISMEKVDHLYWLGRYTERVYTTLRVFFHIYDKMIEQPEGDLCEILRKAEHPEYLYIQPAVRHVISFQ